jgi:hypothetical protein
VVEEIELLLRLDSVPVAVAEFVVFVVAVAVKEGVQLPKSAS